MPNDKLIAQVQVSNSSIASISRVGNNFQSQYNALCAQLDKIKVQAPQGKPAPVAAKAPPGTTDAGASAYGVAYNEASKLLKAVVDGLTPEGVQSLSGIGFSSPGDDAKSRGDILNSILSTWDASASKYMKNQSGDGDAARPALLQRLKEFDSAIASNGTAAVAPD